MEMVENLKRKLSLFIQPPITDTFIDKNKSIIMGEIINKFTFIYNYIIYRVIQLLGLNSLLLTDHNDETKSKDYFIINYICMYYEL